MLGVKANIYSKRKSKMATTRRQKSKRKERKRAGSAQRDENKKSGWTTMEIPDGVEIWTPELKNNRIDIVPYEVGKGNPNAQEGLWYYERTFWIHPNVGINREFYVCPAKTAGKPCPICEFNNEQIKEGEASDEEIKMLRPKERQVWLIHDHNDKENPVKLWEFSHWNFGKLLDEIRKAADDDEDHIKDFDDPDGGSSLKVTFREKTIGKGKPFKEAFMIEFKARKDGLDEEILDHGICLDALLKVPAYELLKKKFFQIDDEEEEEKEDLKKDSKKEKKVEVEKEEDNDDPTAEEKGLKKGDVVTYKDETCTIARISRDGTSLTLLDNEDEALRGIAPSEVELVDTTQDDDPDDDDDWPNDD